ncbi:PHP domain-containing protein [Neobacillus mesonae]|uniref:PHP domain-containing protein n=1 Tax=Neobacillus mesonae TaxID=1193713 RepID=UPI002E1A7A7E|nr:PHP domain-containing protein [Neobacillus mesonae]
MNLLDINAVVGKGNFDLHLHTTASDGRYSPFEVVKMASEKGLTTIAITDHDTLTGLKEATVAGLQFGIEVIPGVEITTKYKETTVDILGYGIQLVEKLKNVLEKIVQDRKSRAFQIIENFRSLGMAITIKDVKKFSKGEVIARPHIASAIVDKGYVKSVQEVFDYYLADGKPCNVDKFYLSPKEGIDLIHHAGGIAVLAHPKLIQDDQLVHELLQFSFDGLEVWHRKHLPKDVHRYRQIAYEKGLIMTGGSDFHTDEDNLGQFGFNNN